MIEPIIFEHASPAWLIVWSVLIAIGLTVFWSHRYLGLNATSATLTALRVAFLVLLAWCLLQPLLRHSATEWLKPRFLVVIDVSESMKQAPDDTLPSRWEVAQKILRQRWPRAVAGQADIEVYGFAGSVGPRLTLEEATRLAPTGEATLLRDALRRISERYRGQPLGGMLLLTDGLDTRESGEDWVRASWPCPIHTVRLEPAISRRLEPDARVARVETPRRVVVGWDSKLTALIHAQGTGGLPFNVQLLESGRLAQEQPIQVPADGGAREVVFRLQHDTVGNFTYTVNIPPLPGETLTTDNSHTVTIQVVDARNRLLYVEGLPRWESKYLTRVLQASRLVTPVIFLQGPGGQFLTVGERGGLTPELTPEQLLQLKTVIIGDLDRATLGEERAEALVKFVEDGGSLVLLGGPNAWGADGFAATALHRLLPAQREGFLPPQEGRFTVRLTDEGRAHPAFLAGQDAWLSAPPVLSIFPGVALAPAAVALVIADTPEGSQPVIVAQRYGQGKVAAILTDSLWRWQLEPGADAYSRFWNQMLLWLSPAETELQPYQLDLFADADQVFLGDTINLGARLGGHEAVIGGELTVTCELQDPDKRRIPFAMSRQRVTTMTGQSFAGYGLAFTARQPGRHTAVAVTEIDGQRIESVPFSFYVKAFTTESNPQPVNARLLRALAEASGGRFLEPDQVGPALAALEFEKGREERITFSSLWNNTPIILLLIGLLAVEWTIRKWKNMA
jgi:hypothetical protein